MSEPRKSRTLIWDLPTRLFHWFLVLSFTIAWLSFDDNRFLFVHVFAGYLFLALLLFRLTWGVIGTHYARFHTFAYDWSSVSEYLGGLLSGKAMRHIGHNPIGGWAIFLMLTLALLVGISGVLTLGGEESHGPLRGLISFKVGIVSHEIHEPLAWIMLVITTIHLLGVIVESLAHRDNLIWAMVRGYKETAAGAHQVRGHHLLGLAIAVVVFSSALYYFRGYLSETADHLYQPYKGPVLPENALWREACGECHFAYHPTLLPKRSWEKMFATLDKHFGDALDLDQETIDELLPFHLDNAAEALLSEPGRKILFYTPEQETPLRVTETHYWVKKHEEIDKDYWKHKTVKTKGNCSACHLDAKQGTYEDSDMRLPTLLP